MLCCLKCEDTHKQILELFIDAFLRELGVVIDDSLFRFVLFKKRNYCIVVSSIPNQKQLVELFAFTPCVASEPFFQIHIASTCLHRAASAFTLYGPNLGA